MNDGPELTPTRDEPILLSSQEVTVAKAGDAIAQSIEVEKSIEDLPAEVQAKLQSAYARVINKELNKKLKKHLEHFLKKLEDPSLLKLKTAILEQLPSEEQVLYKTFMDPDARKKMDYDSVRKFYRAVRKSVKTNENLPSQAENRAILNMAASGLDAMQFFVNNDIPTIMDKTRKIVIVQETQFKRVHVKKSLFRKILETIIPVIKKKQDSVVKTVHEKISSQEKAILQHASDAVLNHFKKVGEGYFDAFDNAVEYKQKAAKGMAINLLQTTEQANEQKAVQSKQKEQQNSKVKKAANVVMDVAQVAYHIDKGVNEWILAKLNNTKPGAYLQHMLEPDSVVTQMTLTEHFRNEFEMASQKEAHNGLVHFARNLANLYLTANRVKQGGYANIEPAQFGFKQLDDPKFAEFLSGFIRSLGFPVEGINDVERFLFETEDPNSLDENSFPNREVYQAHKRKLIERQNDVFGKFVNPATNSSVGMHAVVTLLKKEHQMMISSKGNENYFYLLNLQVQVFDQLQSKERIKNAVDFACREFKLEESFYSPTANDLTTKITGQLKSQLVGRMPEMVQHFLGEPLQMQERARNQFGAMLYNWLEYISEVQRQANETNQMPVKQGLSHDEMKERWEKSASKSAQVAFQFDEVKQIVDAFHAGATKEWQQSAIPLFNKFVDLEGVGFIPKILQQLRADIAELKAQNAHETFVVALEKQMSVLQSLLTPDGNSFDKKALKQATPEVLKLAFDALRQGVESRSAKDTTMSLDEKENFYMISQALNAMNSSYRYFDYVNKIYTQIYQTHFDRIRTMSLSEAGNYIAKKLGAYLEKTLAANMNAPIIQFNFYAKQKMAGLHKLSLPQDESNTINQQQGWWDWGVNQVYTAASYLAPVAVKAAEVGAVPIVMGVGSVYLARLYKKQVAPDAKSVNQAVCDNAKSFIREQTYDALSKMLMQMSMLYTLDERFPKNMNFDTFSQCGLSDRKRYHLLMDKLAKGLGYESIQEFIGFNQEVAAKMAEVDVLKKELAATWFYKAEPQAKLQKAQKELSFLTAIQEDKRKQFAKLPETQQEIENDWFSSLKEVIQTEYAKLTTDIAKGELKNATNYLVLISAMNSMIQQVEFVQQQAIAIELFAPDIDEQIGYDPSARGVMAQLKLAAREDIKTYGSSLARQGILSQLSGSIQTASYFSSQMLQAVSHEMTEALNNKAQRQPAVASAFTRSRSISQVTRAPSLSSATLALDESRPIHRKGGPTGGRNT